MKMEIKTACPYVYETWQVEVPEGLVREELASAASQALARGDAELIDEEHGGEHDREVVRMTTADGPRHAVAS
ncbi:MAG: hypothetical protein EDQ89_02470 [Acidobacteria bacterium]|nr:MAG: hypothetical protein EDQ89_02470 [Acidobacteriota bacterium]MCC6781926.1 hypothetical protein [Planctomycetota bacterium]